MPEETSEDLLEQYLENISVQIIRASKKWRNDQLAEIKTHVLELYNGSLASGAAREEAIRTAIDTVGQPEPLGKLLLREWKLDFAKNSATKTLRYSARASSALLVGTIIALAVGEGMPKVSSLSFAERGLSLALLAMISGMLLGWKFERAGGLLCIGGAIVFDILNYAGSGRLPAMDMITIFAAVGLMFVASSVLDSKTKKNRWNVEFIR
jgi:hypothetical protein